ncbi:hypothetical protein ciss_16130 [Carboxydothermus islandicus]|uniref:Uncharacterized protein n=1 Tax=Carboxydothermus islandicus TaxID=661089 RepID=A0A1L8D3C6_9THEO|nr:hypothetical protein [Carboxydothermus islandicus]GAV25680.1 hypothetical protein ciss_16130 [Carboxydothermus islandicus]
MEKEKQYNRVVSLYSLGLNPVFNQNYRSKNRGQKGYRIRLQQSQRAFISKPALNF